MISVHQASGIMDRSIAGAAAKVALDATLQILHGHWTNKSKRDVHAKSEQIKLTKSNEFLWINFNI